MTLYTSARKLVLLSLTLLLAASCFKRNGERMINLDLLVTNKITGAPIRSTVWVRYKPKSNSSGYQYSSLGTTNEIGRLDVKRRFGNDIYNPQILIRGDDGEYSAFNSDYDYIIETSGSRNKHSYHAKLTPTIFALLHFRNYNCFDETDSLWISVDKYAKKYTATGCADTILYTGNHLWTFASDYTGLIYTVRVKRNGLMSEFQQSFNLIPGEITELLIEY